MNAFIFVFGLLVTIVACGAVGGIWWAALRDGQTHAAISRGEPTAFREPAQLRLRDRIGDGMSGGPWQATVRPSSEARTTETTTTSSQPE